MSSRNIGESDIGRICSAILQERFGFDHVYYDIRRVYGRQIQCLVKGYSDSTNKAAFILEDDALELPLEVLADRILIPEMQKLAFAEWAT